MVYVASDRKSVRKAEKASAQADRARAEIVSGIMSVIPGRAWMLDKLESCHIFASSYHESATATAFAEGERNIGLGLLNDIMQACPDQYIQMMRERNERDASRDTASPGPIDGRDGQRDSEDSDGGDSGAEISGADDPYAETERLRAKA